MEFTQNGYVISTDKRKLQKKVIHNFLKTAYWSMGISRKEVDSTIKHSFCFGVYYKKDQIGFARVISDFTNFGYIADVFVLPEHRKKGISKWLMKVILEHPELKGLKKWMLATKDAHSLYEKFGFTSLKTPEILMELKRKS